MIKDSIKESRNLILNLLNIIITLNLKKILIKNYFSIEIRNSNSIFIIVKYSEINHDPREIFLPIIDSFEVLELMSSDNDILIKSTFRFFCLYIVLMNARHCF